MEGVAVHMMIVYVFASTQDDNRDCDMDLGSISTRINSLSPCHSPCVVLCACKNMRLYSVKSCVLLHLPLKSNVFQGRPSAVALAHDLPAFDVSLGRRGSRTLGAALRATPTLYNR